MYNSQYYTCEQIDQRLLQGYLDDYNTENNTNLTKDQFLAKLGSILDIWKGVDEEPTPNSDKLVKSGGITRVYGEYVENPEFVYVKTDSEGKILWAIKIDGSIYYGAGCPQQVKDYIEEKISSLSLDEYEDMVAFLNDLEKGDKTLQALLDEKVDKEEGKSLIDKEYASTKSTIGNPEFLEVTTDSEDKVLECLQKDGTKVIGGDLKVLGSMEVSGVSYKVIENPEYLVAWVDAEDKVLFGLKVDGKTYVGDADFLNDVESIKAFLANFNDKNIDWDALTSITATENPEFIEVELDANNKILSGRKVDGTKFENNDVELNGNATVGGSLEVDGVVIKNIEDPEGRSEITTDKEGKVISYRKKDGTKVESVGLEVPKVLTENLTLSEEGMNDFQKALRNSGFTGGSGDWTEYSYIHIPSQPTCAMMNIYGIEAMPTSKTANLHAYAEFWDKNGNFFKKKVILNVQGATSIAHAKKNLSIDFCEDDWIGDDTTTIKIGDWVSQDSFHLKAFYTSITKGECPVCYKLFEEMTNTYVFEERKAYMEYYANEYTDSNAPSSDLGQNMEFSARCFPDGFPCIIYLNGAFYGIFSWQLKKHRDNYHMDRNAEGEIHLDGMLNPDTIFNGDISWDSFEVRNPKPKKSKWTLLCQDGTNYDGDNPKELMGTDSEFYDASNNSCKKSAKTKAVIEELSHYKEDLAVFEDAYKSIADKTSAEAESALAALKSEFEKRFSVKNLIDFALLSTLTADYDSMSKNWQWTTWGKINGTVKWFIHPYDKDTVFGINGVLGTETYAAFNDDIGTNTFPVSYIYHYYVEELHERYKELSDKNILTYEGIFKYINNWVNRVGFDNYKLEYKKWPDTPCNRNSGINEEYWERTGSNYLTYSSNGSNWNRNTPYALDALTAYKHKVYKSLVANNLGNTPDESPTKWELLSVEAKEYHAGDEVYDGYGNFFKFRAKKTVVVTTDSENELRWDTHFVNAPYEKIYEGYPHENGTHDSIYRLSKWIRKQIQYMNERYIH